MTLSEWHDQPGKTLASLSAATGLSKGYLNNLAKGRRSPSLDAARRIETATDGDIPLASWPKTVEREAA